MVATAFGAIAARRRVRFTYRQEDRLVDPWRLSYRRGQWYLAGLDHTRGEERLFRLDRIAGVLRVEGPPGAFARPAPDAAGPAPPWRFGDEEEIRAELLVDADQVQWAVDALGADAISTRRPDGSVVFEVGVTDVAAFRSFVLGFLDHAEILGPPDLRHDMVEWLARLAQPAAAPAGGADSTAPPPPSPLSPRPGRG
jgi:predicted DNA-binding transcriptional regulator YafY